MVVKYSKKYKGGRYTRKIRGGAWPPGKGSPKSYQVTRKRGRRANSDPVDKRDLTPHVAGLKATIKRTAQLHGPAQASAMFGTRGGFEQDAERETKRARTIQDVETDLKKDPQSDAGYRALGAKNFEHGNEFVFESMNKIDGLQKEKGKLEKSGKERKIIVDAAVEYCKTATAYTVVGLNISKDSYLELLAAMTKFTADTLSGGIQILSKLLKMTGVVGGVNYALIKAQGLLGQILGMHPAFQTLICSYISYMYGRNEDRAASLTDATAAAGEATSETLNKDAKTLAKNFYVKFGELATVVASAREGIKEKADRTALIGLQMATDGLLYYQGKADSEGTLMAAVYLAQDASTSVASGTHKLVFETFAPSARMLSGMDAAQQAGQYVLAHIDFKNGAITKVSEVFDDFITYANEIQNLEKLCIYEKQETGKALLKHKPVTFRPHGLPKYNKKIQKFLGFTPSQIESGAAAASGRSGAVAAAGRSAAPARAKAPRRSGRRGQGRGGVKSNLGKGGGRKTRKRKKSRRNSRKGGYKYKKKKSSRRRN